MPQDAEPGAGHAAQRHPVGSVQQVVLAVAEEREVPVGQPPQQRLDLGGRFVARRRFPLRRHRQLLGQLHRPGLHPVPVLHRHPHVAEHPLEILLQLGTLAVGQPAYLDVGPGLGDLIVGLPLPVDHADDLVQLPSDVALDEELRMYDQVRGHIVPGELHPDRVHEERHVVGDDVHDIPAGGARRCLATADAHQGPALRPVGGELGLLDSRRGQALRPSGGEVLERDVPVVGAQVGTEFANLGRAARGGADRCRLGQQGFLLVAHDVSHPCHSFVVAGGHAGGSSRRYYNQSRSSQSRG